MKEIQKHYPGPLLIDIPKSFIEGTFHTSGANVLSQKIYKELLPYYESVIVYSDASTALIKQCDWLQHPSLIHITSLTALEHLRPLPRLAFSTSADISKLLQVRNFFQYTFPVIGIIHSLGTPKSFSMILDAFPHLNQHDGFICPSNATDQTLKQLASKSPYKPTFQSFVIQHGVETTRFKPKDTTEKQWLRDYFRFNGDDIILLHVSRLSPFTKMDIFPTIKSLTEIIKTHPKLKLWIVGSNHHPQYIQIIQKYIRSQHLEDNIFIDTDPDHNEMEKYYQTADAFVFMSDCRAETFGLTTAEALSSGLPVIVSDVGGLSEIVHQEKTGLIIPTISGDINLDPSANFGSNFEFGNKSIQGTAFSHPHFKAAIVKLLDSSTRHSMGESARQYALEKLDIQHMIDRYLDTFTTLEHTQGHYNFPSVPLENVDSLLLHTTSDYLSSMTSISITEKGRSVFLDQVPFFGMSKHLEDYPFIYSILKLLNEQTTAHVKEIREQYSCSPSWIDATLIYMIKHDLISWG